MTKSMVTKCVAIVGVTLCAATVNAGLILTAAGTAGDHLFIGSPDITFTSAYNTVPAGSSANIYWDADRDGVFGEAGESSGNTSGSLAFNAPITNGIPLHFGMEGFSGAGSTGAIEFTLQLSDLSTIRQLVHEGTPFVFNDSDGTEWTATFDFVNQAYGDVVFNIGTGAGGATADHQGILTFTSPLPEPSTLMLAGIAVIGLVVRRRRRS